MTKKNETPKNNFNATIGNTVLPDVPFTYEWWIEVGKKAYWKAENLAWHSYYWEVADFCRSRAEDCEFKRHSR